jgi:hypothetical protein
MNRGLVAWVCGGLLLAGVLTGVAVWGSRMGPPAPPVVIEVLDRGAHWKVTGTPSSLSDEGDTQLSVQVGQRVIMRNREDVPHWIGPFRIPTGGEMTGAFQREGVVLGRCAPDAPSTLRIVVRGA